MNKKYWIITSISLLVFAAAAVTAAPPTSYYLPLETNDPTCAPGDLNCDVELNFLTTEVDGDITNEIQDLSLSGSTLSLSGSAGAPIDLSSVGAMNTDDQALTLSGSVLSLEDGWDVNLSSLAGMGSPWFGSDDNMSATDNTENIYSLGNVWIWIDDPLHLLHVATTNGSGLRVVDQWAARTSNVIGGYSLNSTWTDSHASVIFGGSSYVGAGAVNTANPGANTIGNNSYLGAISGWYDHVIWDNSYASTIAWGWHNMVADNSTHSTISWGSYNEAVWDYVTIVWGTLNTMTLTGSWTNTNYSVISGWVNNTLNGRSSVIAWGNGNVVNEDLIFLWGGSNNTANGDHSIIVWGRNSTANGIGSAILGGDNNVASGTYSTILNGRNNSVAGSRSVVLWGWDNISVTGIGSMWFGYNTVVWGHWSIWFSDYSPTDPAFSVAAPDVFGARFAGWYWFTGGNVGVGTTAPTWKLHVTSDVTWGSQLANIVLNDESGNAAAVSAHGSGLWLWWNASLANIGTDPMVYLADTNFVGIGTINPQSTLHVEAPAVKGEFVSTTGNLSFELDAPAGNRTLFWFQKWGTTRWIIENDAIAETGGNTWSNFDINRYNDAGAYIGTALTIERETGYVGINTTNPGSVLSVGGLPSGTDDTVTPGALAGAVCITNAGNMYIDTDGTCAN